MLMRCFQAKPALQTVDTAEIRGKVVDTASQGRQYSEGLGLVRLKDIAFVKASPDIQISEEWRDERLPRRTSPIGT